MRAAVFVRYHSGDGFGHLAWAFDWAPELVSAGAVENHSGSLDTPAQKMGFWSSFSSDPTPHMRELHYDDVKYMEVACPDPRRAYRVVQWIKRQPFHAIHRNCLDDTYDVLRAFGVKHLAPPSHVIIPNNWFERLKAPQAHISDFSWQNGRAAAGASGIAGAGVSGVADANVDAPSSRVILSPSKDVPAHNPEGAHSPSQIPADARDLPPLRPTWRRPWHPHFHVLNLQKLLPRS